MVGECGRFFFTSCERRERTSEHSERVSSATPRNEGRKLLSVRVIGSFEISKVREIEVTSWLVSADDFSSRVARGANERVSAANE